MGKTSKFTMEEVREKLKDKGFKLLSEEYKDVDSVINVVDNDGYFYNTTLWRLMNRGVRSIHKANIYSIQNIKKMVN